MIEIDNNGRILDLEAALGPTFLEIENPSRYLGSEYYFGRKNFSTGDLKCAMCFPDLYEIGMSNNAVKEGFPLLFQRSYLQPS